MKVLVRDGRHFADVDERERRVRGRLDPDELGGGADQLGDVDFDARAEGHLDVVRKGDFGEVAMRAAVDVGHGNDVRAARERLKDVGGGCGARTEREGVPGMF
jgi:hypothetical protein